MSLHVQVAARTDIGCVRTNNEDNFGYDWRYGIYVVCDGMGGQAAGEVASKMAVDSVLNYFRQAGKERSYPPPVRFFDGLSPEASALASAIQLANQQIHRAAQDDPQYAGMGSTITSVLVKGDNYIIAHVGDSRIYLLRTGAQGQAGMIQQLTNDHSLVMEQVRLGLISPEQAANSSIQNIIIRALGSEENVEADLSELRAEPGDTLLLTSDGLTRHVPDPQILEIVQEQPELRDACQALIQAAKLAGGQDNITCLLLRFANHHWKLFGKDSPGDGVPEYQDSQ